MCEANSYRPTLAPALYNLGHAVASQRDFVVARRLLHESLILSGQLGDRRRQAFALAAVATLVAAQGEHARAIRLNASAGATIERLGAVLAPAMGAVYDAQLEPSRSALGERSVAEANALGGAMPFEDAVAEALAWLAESAAPSPSPEPPIRSDDPPIMPETIVLPEHPPAASGPAPAQSRDAHPLTPRELAVAQLIARGLTNRQIAARLIITEGTTSNYVQRVMTRLGFHTRAQIATWIVERGLTEPAEDDER